ncbi:MAG: hypothetical protein K2Q22_07760, partial [Cytophagales bacterium]|nr:hypothetical protein [Cytophagales bacterium]
MQVNRRGHFIFRIFIFLVCSQWITYDSLAQSPVDESKYYNKRERTSTTSFEPNHKINKNHKIIPIYLSVNSTRSVLYGNPCATKITRDMGFEYHILTKLEKETIPNPEWQNFLSEIQVFFKNGPFWKARAKKGIEDCRRKTGDYV